MDLSLHSCIFYSTDLERIRQFYENDLGFTVEYQHESKYASFIFSNNARLGIKLADASREIVGSQTAIVNVEKITEVYSLCKEKGIQIYKDLRVETWGETFSILDPDGNKIEFLQNS